jgi:hypothetical protein
MNGDIFWTFANIFFFLIFLVLTIMILDLKSLPNMSTCERGFQKRKRQFLPGIEAASSVVDDSNPLPPDRQG